ncbi:hypothetical protein E2K98_30205 [Bacillus salipaludis]|uniref:Uncharacterized protein n=1 Tax=Bacillus salipaludis TaxID=2547811 RepID=A0A4R5VH76_9BACI|nr:hypothetical protein [Bacillus salipaludis]TDK53405.1 hypothetical protein E2K98_30205 [Bacillus salipaludis]
MSEDQKKKNKSILGDNLNLDTLFNTTSPSNNNNDALMNLAGSLMQNPNTMNSLMKVASSLFTNDTIVNSVTDINKPKQDGPTPDTAPAQENTELSLISSQLEKLSDELSEIKAQLNEFKEHNKKLIEYILNTNQNSKKK